ncbi:MAG: hypothetical protein G01um101449_63 [Parcubacteria group bacterium Gr01-1014_49]|nr:MAG: hypothetical protein G01um101449_63 [Parcubacteria group bacterium Gr01-1014_49]
MTQSASPDIIAVATSFVNLLFKEDWGETELTPAEVEVLFATVSAAGFNPKEVVKDGLSDEVSHTDYHVIDQSGHVHAAATNWLNRAFFCTSMYRSKLIPPKRLWVPGQVDCRENAIDAIKTEIERSIPLEPIQLTPDGERLREFPYNPTLNGFSRPPVQAFVDHTRDEHEFRGEVGIHDYCEGRMKRIRVAETRDALICGRCHLRVLFPKEVQTYGELRGFLAAKIRLAPRG